MNITRKSLTSAGCGIVLTTGLIVILVLITWPFIHDLPASIQKSIPMFIFFFSLFIFCIPAGMISISAGILIMKHRKFLKFR
ncbi:MAG: hypothetical protein OIN88_11875 [Candidatus Methanoperedens sp.]|nr:hypothetical protein [Candidatus Methanoperedens sp.]